MQRQFIGGLVMGFALMVAPVESEAQAKPYDDSALRVDVAPGALRVVRGVRDSVVLTIGGFKRADLSGLVAASSNAVPHARLFEANYRAGWSFAAVGIAAIGGAIGLSRMNVDQPIPALVAASSAGLIAYGAHRLDIAYRGLSKAIWWYNRDLRK